MKIVDTFLVYDADDRYYKTFKKIHLLVNGSYVEEIPGMKDTDYKVVSKEDFDRWSAMMSEKLKVS